jgi:hypothetical protein
MRDLEKRSFAPEERSLDSEITRIVRRLLRYAAVWYGLVSYFAPP